MSHHFSRLVHTDDVPALEDDSSAIIQWPSADAHLRPSSNINIRCIVSLNPEPKQHTEQVPYTRTSPSQPPPHQWNRDLSSSPQPDSISWDQPSIHQSVCYEDRVSPRNLTQREQDKEITMEDWDPMKDDFDSKNFNSYNKGPCAGVPGRSNTSNEDGKQGNNWYRLHLGGLPREMSEDGLANLVGQICEVQRVTVVNPRDESQNFSYGFVNVPTQNDIEKVMAKLNGFNMKGRTIRVNRATPRPGGGGSGSSSSFSPRGDASGGGSSFSPKGDANMPVMNNNSMQNRPFSSPRTLENRYGSVKSPTSPKDAPQRGNNQSRMQNGTQSGGEESKTKAPDMVPMAVTRKMHLDQKESASSRSPGATTSSSKETSSVLPSKGRGQVLQQALSGRTQAVGASPSASSHDVSNKHELDREHVLNTDASFDTQVADTVNKVPDVPDRNKTFANARDADSVERKATDIANKTLTTKPPSGHVPEQAQSKVNRGTVGCNKAGNSNNKRGLVDTYAKKPQVPGQASTTSVKGRNVHSAGRSPRQPGVKRGGFVNNQRNPMVRSQERAKGDNKRMMGQRRMHDKGSRGNRNNARVEPKSLDTGDHLTKYVLVDKDNQVEYLGVLEEVDEGDLEDSSQAPTDGDVAQVMQIEDRRPSRGRYRGMSGAYPPYHGYQESYSPNNGPYPPNSYPPGFPMPPPPPYVPYGPYPPPWYNGYYGSYFNPEAMNNWRPRGRSAAGFRIQERLNRDNQLVLMRRGRSFGRPRPYHPRFPSPYQDDVYVLSDEPSEVQLRELSRSPSPNRNSGQVEPSELQDDEVDVISVDENQSKQHNTAVQSVGSDEGKLSLDGKTEVQDSLLVDTSLVTSGTEDEPSCQEASTVDNAQNEMCSESMEALSSSNVIQAETSTDVIQETTVLAVSAKQIDKETGVGETSSQLEQKEARLCKENEQEKSSQDVRKKAALSPTKGGSPTKKGKPKPCTNCGNLGTAKCSKCKIPYCTRECQSKHWAKHKLECNAIANNTGDTPDRAQTQQTISPTKYDMKRGSPSNTMLASKPGYVPNPQASAVYGRFLSKDVAVASPQKDIMEVLVTVVENPECLYVQLLQASNVKGYAALKTQMKNTYGTPTANTAKDLQFYLSQVGELCAVETFGEWLRAEILSGRNSDEDVEVMLVDYGRCETLPRKNLRRLKEEMVKLPKQGVKCFLTSIRSQEPDGRWSPRAGELLKSRTLNRACRVEFKGYNDKRGYEINLFASQNASVSVSEELVTSHLAKHKATPPSSKPTPQATMPKSPDPRAAAATTSSGQRPSILDNISEGSRLRIKLNYVASVDVMYGCLAEHENDLREMQEMLNMPGVLDSGDRTYFYPEIAQLIVARFSDNQWYRAKVNRITTPEKCSVQFVDYGNREEVAIAKCQDLPAHFGNKPFQAVRLALAGVQRPESGWPKEVEMAFRTWMGEGDVEATVVRKHKDHLEVELFSPKSSDPQMSFNSILADAGMAPTQPALKPTEQASGVHQSTAAVDDSNVELKSMVVWINSPIDFYIQLIEDAGEMATLLSALNMHYANSRSNNYAPAVGDKCAALYSDGTWYRAEAMEKMSPVSTKVFFMDYGNEDVIEIDNIRPLEERFKAVPGKALRCGLNRIAPVGGSGAKWSEGTLTFMRKKLENKPCVVRVKRVIDGKRYIELEHDGVEMSKELVKAKLCIVEEPAKQQLPPVQPAQVSSPQIPARTLPPSKFQGMVIWLNNPSDMYVQLYVQEIIQEFQGLELALQSHYEQLSGAATAPSGYQPRVGEACAVKSPEHGQWFRSRIVAITAPRSYRVHYLDYGNEENVTSNVHRIEEQFCVFPAMAAQCALSGISPAAGSQWSPEATAFLKSEVIDQLFDLCVSAPPNGVTMSKKGASVAQKLVAKGLAKPSTATSQQPSAATKNPPATQTTPVVALQRPSATAQTGRDDTSPRVNLGTVKPPTQEFQASATHLNSPSDIYIQINIPDIVKAFQELEQSINNHCKETAYSSTHRISVGDLCIAKSSGDGVWYRARVTKIVDGGAAVNFIDYGNDEVVKKEDIRPLLEQFTKVPVMAVHCSLAGVCPPGGGKVWNKEASEFVAKKMLQTVLKGNTVESIGSNSYAIDFMIQQDQGPPVSVSQALIKTGLAKNPAVLSPPRKNVEQVPQQQRPTPTKTNVVVTSPPVKQTAVAKPSPIATGGSGTKLTVAPAAPPGKEFEARVSVVNSPSDFYLALQTANQQNDEAMQKLKQDLIACYADSAPDTGYQPKVDDFVVATRKGMWGRARLIEADGAKMKLLFVDYGMEDVVEGGAVRQMKEQFTNPPMMALHCTLADIVSPGNKPWKPDTINIVREKIRGCRSQVIVKSSDGSGLHSVELLVTMKNGNPLVVIDEMVKHRLAFPANQPMRSPKGKSPHGNQPMKGGQRGSPNPVNQPMRNPQGKSPDLNRSPSDKGAFQKYQKTDTQSGKSPDSAQPSQRKPTVTPPASVPSPVAASKPPVSKQAKAQVPPSAEFPAMIVWFNNPSSFFVTVASEESMKLSSTITNALNAEYANAAKSSHRPAVGDMVVSRFDGAWYRAMVQSISASTATVLYVDYGNQEVASVDDLHKITDELRKLPILAMHCKLAGVAPSTGKTWSEETIQYTKPLVIDQLCMVSVTDNSSDVLQVKLLKVIDGVPSLDTNAEMIKQGFAVEYTATSTRNSPTMDRSPQQASNRGLAMTFPGQELSSDGRKSPNVTEQNMIILPKLPLPKEDFHAVAVVVNDPGSFYIQVASKENAEEITKLGIGLNSYYSREGMRSYRPSEGELCAAQFSQDNGWYRAKAIQEMSSGGVMKVLFVDFGNEEEVSTDAIRELSREFHKVPIMAQHCSLAGVLPSVDQGGKWSSKVTEYMTSKVTVDLCEVHIVDGSTDPISVELVYATHSDKPTKLSEELVSMKMARKQSANAAKAVASTRNAPVRAKQSHHEETRRVQIQNGILPKDSFQGLISDSTDPGDFYVQVMTHENATNLATLTRNLNSTYGNAGPSSFHPTIGGACVAPDKASGEWYRAVAEEHASRDQIIVRFVDYGNAEEVKCENIHELDEKLIKDRPAMAVNCALAGVKPTGPEWNREAITLIKECTSSMMVNIKVVGKQEGIPSVLVEVTPTEGDQVSINQQLINRGLAGHQVAPTPPASSLTNGGLSPATNGGRPSSSASNDSNASDVSTLHVKLSEQDLELRKAKQQLSLQDQRLRDQEKAMAEQRREMEYLKQLMMQKVGAK